MKEKNRDNGYTSNKCPVHETPERYKYLGDVLPKNTIENMEVKGNAVAVFPKMSSILSEISLSRRTIIKVGPVVRDKWFLNGCLFNSKTRFTCNW